MPEKITITENIFIMGNQVWLKIDNQSFPVGMYWNNLNEAKWYAEQLKTALSKLNG
jgi:hypothetical protein